jgi:GNAT superfamily N-acetyltransferase
MADAAALSAIKRAVSERAYNGLMSERELDWWLGRPCAEDHFAAMIEDPACAVVIDQEHGGVGSVRFAEAAYIGDVYVERAGAGAGRRIVDALLDRADVAGLTGAECSVMAWSAEAIAFWERIGFRRGRFATQPAWDPEGLMRDVGSMRSRTLSTRYLAYVRVI